MIFVVKLCVVGGFKKQSQQPPRAPYLCQTNFCLFSSQGFVFRFVFPFLHPSPARLSAPSLSVCLTPGAGTGDTFSAPLYTSVVVVSLTALVALVVLLVNCVTCCKEREIDFKVRVPGQQAPRTAGTHFFLPQEGMGITTPPNSFDWSLLQRLFFFCGHLADFPSLPASHPRRSLKTTLTMRSTSRRQQRTRPPSSPRLKCTRLPCPQWPFPDPRISSHLPASQVRSLSLFC